MCSAKAGGCGTERCRRIEPNRSLIQGLLTADPNAEVSNLGDDNGYFIYEVDERPVFGGIIVLAKAASEDAAHKLAEMWFINRRAS